MDIMIVNVGMACGELNSKGYNTTPYGVFK